MLDGTGPLFQQIAERIRADVLSGRLAEGDRAPSTNECAVFYRINPATAAKGLNLLVEQGVLEKHRGLGMFVTTGARERLLAESRDEFTDRYLRPLLAEAARLGYDVGTLTRLLHDVATTDSDPAPPAPQQPRTPDRNREEAS